ncbi:GyrI-like domain-containing protein [Microbacterium sp. NPDC008134]|uniref:GyrI-like domain-containing protein n=1 Tax=Microbacterium sp. NPDC008134 TaxID=3364183 RepID=UPI0036E78BC6
MTAFPDGPFGATERLTLDPVPLAVIRHDGIRLAALRDAFDTGYGAIAAFFHDGALVPTGPALAIYHGDPMGVFDLELGFPVSAAPVEPLGGPSGVSVRGSTLPTGDATATTYVGVYDGLGSAWMGLAERSSAEGLHHRGIWIEVYVSDPSEGPDDLRTDLILPVA